MNINKNSLTVKGTNIISKSKVNQLAKNMIKRSMEMSEGRETGDTPQSSMGIDSLNVDEQQSIQDAIESGKGSLDTSNITFSDDISEGISEDSFGQDSIGDADSPGGGPGGAATEGVMKQGGLASKKKRKVKKMKRGGLASR